MKIDRKQKPHTPRTREARELLVGAVFAIDESGHALMRIAPPTNFELYDHTIASRCVLTLDLADGLIFHLPSDALVIALDYTMQVHGPLELV